MKGASNEGNNDGRDARVLELEFLAYLEQNGPIVEISAATHDKLGLPDRILRDMVLGLLCGGCATGEEPSVYEPLWIASKPSDPRAHLWSASTRTLRQLLSNKFPYTLRLSHDGRLRMAILRQELDQGRIRDATGILFDGRYIERDLRIRLAMAGGDGVWVLMADLDHFKEVNDLHGHVRGDEAIRRYFSVVRDLTSANDGDAYRRGGDETIAMLRDLGLDRSLQVAEAIRESVKTELASFAGDEHPPTVSIGLLLARAPEVPRVILEAVDKLVYTAKREGRNKVVTRG